MSSSKKVDDKAKGMAYRFDIESVFINVNAQVKKTIVRDPGTEKEMSLPAGTENVNLNFGGQLSTPEQLAELIKTNPEVANILVVILNQVSEGYTFEAPAGKK